MVFTEDQRQELKALTEVSEVKFRKIGSGHYKTSDGRFSLVRNDGPGSKGKKGYTLFDNESKDRFGEPRSVDHRVLLKDAPRRVRRYLAKGGA